MLSVTFFRKTVAVKVNGSERGVFLTLVRRESEEDKFNFRDGITLALGLDEMGLLARHLERGIPKEVKFVHKLEKSEAKVFTSQLRTDDEGATNFFFRLSQGDRAITFPISLGEAYVLVKFLTQAILKQLEKVEEQSTDKQQNGEVTQDAPAENPKNANKRRGKKAASSAEEADEFFPEGII